MNACTSYFPQFSIFNMIELEYTECAELDGVVSLGVTPVPNYRLIVQDAAGGVQSAIAATCSTTNSDHPCTAAVAAAVAAIPVGHSVTLKGFVLGDPVDPDGFWIDSIVDNGPTTMPAAVAVPLSAITPQERYPLRPWGSELRSALRDQEPSSQLALSLDREDVARLEGVAVPQARVDRVAHVNPSRLAMRLATFTVSPQRS